jgi:hypothetical protein
MLQNGISAATEGGYLSSMSRTVRSLYEVGELAFGVGPRNQQIDRPGGNVAVGCELDRFDGGGHCSDQESAGRLAELAASAVHKGGDSRELRAA